MAKLALVVEKLDDVPESLRGAYVEREGRYALDADLPDVAALEADRAEERRLRAAAEAAMRKAVGEAERLKNEKKAAAAGLKGDELDKLRADVRAEVEAEYAPIRAERDTLTAESREHFLVGAVKRLAGDAKTGNVLPERIDGFWKLHADEFELTADRKIVVRGHPGTDVTKHVAALAKQNPEWQVGTKMGGGGAGGGAGGAGIGSGMTSEEVVKNPSRALAEHYANAG